MTEAVQEWRLQFIVRSAFFCITHNMRPIKHPQGSFTLLWVIGYLAFFCFFLCLCLSLAYGHTPFPQYSLCIYFLLFAPVNLLSHWSRLTKNWSPGFTEATVSQYSFYTMEGRKNRLKHPVGTVQEKGSNKPRQRRLRQIQKAWRVYEKGVGGSRDEHRQVSRWSAVPLTSMQLDSCFYQHNWKQSK